jgi:hypothetical protein
VKALVVLGATIGVLGWTALYALVGPWGCLALAVIGLLGVVAAVNYAFYGHALPPEER